MRTVMLQELRAAIDAMRHYDAPWAIAGGWAIDLFLGRRTRQHADVDIAILRSDQRLLWTAMQPRAAEYVEEGVVRAWHQDTWLALPIHELYVTTAAGDRCEILLNEHDTATGEWVYRRDARVRRAMSRAIRYAQQVPFLAPEIVLLYKSKSPRATDEADFAAAIAAMDGEARDWLRAALRTSAPGHPWEAALTNRR